MPVIRAAFTAVIVGAALASAHAQPAPRPVGQLVDLGGRRLHQICSGVGSPVVIIENGAASFAVEWTAVQTEVAKFTRVCSYDRAGYAWSDKGPRQDTIEQTMDDLHLLLRKTPQPPYVLVGASLGAIYVRAYQRRFPTTESPSRRSSARTILGVRETRPGGRPVAEGRRRRGILAAGVHRAATSAPGGGASIG